MKASVLIVTSALSILAAAAAFFLVPDILGDAAMALSLDASDDTFRLTVAMLAFVGVWGIWAVLFGRPRPERAGEEHGSARWATIRQARYFRAREDTRTRPFVGRNLILSDGCSLSVGSVRRRYQRNKNVFVIGGPSSGKTRYYIKANLCQLTTDFVVSDPKGTLIEECGAMFQEAGYQIRSFNTFELDKSDHYNPLKYVKTDVDILKFVRFLIKNTKGGDEKGSAADPFWEDAETLLLTGLIAYLRDWCNPEDYTISGLLTLLSLAEARDEDEGFKSALDYLFDEIETGRTWVMDETGQTDYNEQARWAELADDAGYHLVPSTLRHNTSGMSPYRIYCEKNGVREANQRAREKMRAIKEHVISTATEDVAEKDGQTLDEVRRDVWRAYLDRRGYRLQADMLNALITQEREAPGGTGLGPDDDLALKYYRDFKTAAGKTLKSILVSSNVRVAPFAIGGVRELLSFDEMDIDALGSGTGPKTVIFAIMEDTDDTLSFMLAMLMWQIINHLCSIALTRHHGSLPAPVNILLDEFGNLGYLNGIERSIAVCRSRNIFLSPVVQDLSQIRKVYDENTMRTILACCDVKLFLGGDELETTKYFSELLGRQSITQRTFNQTRGQNANYTHNYNTLGRSLMEADEIGRMDSERCIVKIRGFDPILDRKYRLERHPNYGLLFGEGNTKYTEPFDFREYRKRRNAETVRG